MPDREAPVSLAQHSFTAGEVAPGIYGRQDLAKYHTGCAVMRNWFVDPKGGATIRPGSQYVAGFGAAGYGRLIPFQFSPTIGQTYVLCFSALNLRFIKNPGTACYRNGSNAGLITSGGVPYEIATPYGEDDLRGLHYVQIADVMWLTCRGHTRRKLQRLADDNWTLSEVSAVPSIAAPTMVAIDVTAAAAVFTDPVPPVQTRYMYCVSAVTSDGDESLPSVPMVSDAGINIATTQGTVTLTWTAVSGAAYYKVYKALPAHGDKVPAPSEQFGFAGYSYGTTFTDSNIVADFTHSPIQPADPFAPGAIVGYTITNPGTGYPVEGTTITVTDPDGSGAVIYPVLGDNTAAATSSIVGLYIANPGSGYTAPTVAALGGGADFAATLELGPSSGIDPSALGLFQQRLIYASTEEKPNSIFASRSGAPDDFRKTNPTVDSDAFEFQIFDQQVTRIFWMRSMPGGLLIGTDVGIVQLTGGSAAVSNPVAVTPTNAVVVPQSYFGSADIPPVVIDYNVLFVQREGIVRDLQYNFIASIYTGTDLTVMSNHLFGDMRVVDWAYQDTPNKVIWCVLDNGLLLSLTYLKAQEVIGWARHDTMLGLYESVVSIQEGEVNAIYFSVLRNGQRMIERQAQQIFWQDSDAWQLDAALSIQSNYPAANMQVGASVGTDVGVNADAAVFAPGDVGSIINAVGSRATITGYVSPTEVRVTITRAFGSLFLPEGLWRMDPVVSGISGLGHLEGMTVYALVDGVAQGPFSVTGGSITLTTPGSQVVVGLAYQAQLQPLYADVPGETTIQGRRKKIAAASIRLRNAKGLKYGPSFGTVVPWNGGYSSTDTAVGLPYGVTGLYTGDQRLWLDQAFDIGGWVCIQQDDPYPATILLIVAEMALGDTM